MTAEVKLDFAKDERILCFHGPVLYEAKVLKSDRWKSGENGTDGGPHYFVHYKGWKQSWDEWVPENRILHWNEDNLQRQKDLQQIYARKKDVLKRDKRVDVLTSASTSNSNKRNRDMMVEKEEEFLKRPEIKIPIPDALKVQLVDDWEYVTKHQRLVSLPRTPTVKDILEDFRAAKQENNNEQGQEDAIHEMVDGLLLYFNTALGSILLYRFERQQYAEIRKRIPNVAMSDIYGAEHFLRLFVQLPMLVAHTSMDQESILTLKGYLNQILLFIQKYSSKYFLSEYENASPDYVAIQSVV